MDRIPDCFYRVSVKALVYNEDRGKFLIIREDNGRWELPGGGLEWGKRPHEELKREIREEMGLETTWIAEQPSYLLLAKSIAYKPAWVANVVYETTLESLDFTPSSECQEIAFVNAVELGDRYACDQVVELVHLLATQHS